MIKWIIAIIATEALAEISVESALFDRLRSRISQGRPILGELLACGWCQSFWIAIPVFAVVHFGYWYFLMPLVIHRMSNVAHDLMMILKRLKRETTDAIF